MQDQTFFGSGTGFPKGKYLEEKQGSTGEGTIHLLYGGGTLENKLPRPKQKNNEGTSVWRRERNTLSEEARGLPWI